MDGGIKHDQMTDGVTMATTNDIWQFEPCEADASAQESELPPETLEDDTEPGVYLESTLCDKFPNDAPRLQGEAAPEVDVITLEPFSEKDRQQGLVRVRFVPGCGARTQLHCYALGSLYEHLRHQNRDMVLNKYRYSQSDLDKITELFRQNVDSRAVRLRADEKLSTQEYTEQLSQQAAQSLVEREHHRSHPPRHRAVHDWHARVRRSGQHTDEDYLVRIAQMESLYGCVSED